MSGFGLALADGGEGAHSAWVVVFGASEGDCWVEQVFEILNQLVVYYGHIIAVIKQIPFPGCPLRAFQLPMVNRLVPRRNP